LAILAAPAPLERSTDGSFAIASAKHATIEPIAPSRPVACARSMLAHPNKNFPSGTAKIASSTNRVATITTHHEQLGPSQMPSFSLSNFGDRMMNRLRILSVSKTPRPDSRLPRLGRGGLATLTLAAVAALLGGNTASANYLASLRGPGSDGPNKIVLLGDDGHYIKDFVAAGVGGLHGPTGLAYGPDGNLYVSNASAGANNIVKFDGQTGAPLGVFASGLNGPTGLRYNNNPLDPSFYAANFGNFAGNTVSKINATTGVATNFGSGHALPTSIAVDGSGNVYVGEFGLGGVNKYDSTGAPLTSGTVGATGGVSFDPNNGKLLVADVVGDRILTWDGTNANPPTQSLAIDENFVASIIGAPTATNLFVGGQTYLHNSTTDSVVYSTGLGIILKYTAGNPTPTTFANFFLLDPLNGVSIGDVVFTTAVPEPSSVVLAGVAGLGALALAARRRRAQAGLARSR
jgi:hypothetical protein